MKKMILLNGPRPLPSPVERDGNPIKGILIGLAVSVPLWITLALILAAFGG